MNKRTSVSVSEQVSPKATRGGEAECKVSPAVSASELEIETLIYAGVLRYRSSLRGFRYSPRDPVRETDPDPDPEYS